MLLLTVLNTLNQFVHRNLTTVLFAAAIVVLVTGIWIMGSGFKKVTMVFFDGHLARVRTCSFVGAGGN